MKPVYAMYKADNLLHIGTVDEIAEAHGVKGETILFYATPSYRKRCENSKTGNHITVTKLEEEEG